MSTFDPFAPAAMKAAPSSKAERSKRNKIEAGLLTSLRQQGLAAREPNHPWKRSVLSPKKSKDKDHEN